MIVKQLANLQCKPECLHMATKPDALSEGSVPFEVSLQVRCAFVLLKHPILSVLQTQKCFFFFPD